MDAEDLNTALRYGRVNAIPDWNPHEDYTAFDIVRGQDGELYAATRGTRKGPPPGEGWQPHPAPRRVTVKG